MIRKTKKINKKGQGEFVAYVLLIGLAVALSVIVSKWSLDQSKRAGDNLIRSNDIEEKCNEISLSGFVNCPDTQKITITNRGNLIIKSLRITGEDNKNCGFSGDQEVNLKPGKSVTKNLNNCNTALILPLMKISNDEIVGCSEKKLVLNLIC